MADNSLVIRINADIKDFDKKLGEIEKSTSQLEGKLSSVAKQSAVAFAALTGEAILAVKAFAESEDATKRLSLALQNQGLYSRQLIKDYGDIADAISMKTGLDDDEIKAAMAVTQGMIGQVKITDKLTMAIADLAANQRMSLEAASEFVSKGINGQVTGLNKLGFTIDESLPKQERMAQIIQQISGRMGGAAEAANQGLGSIKGLTTAFGNFQEAIGERLAPTITKVVAGLTAMFNFFGKNQEVMNLVVSMGAAAAITTGLTAALATGALAWLKFSSAMVAAGVAANGTSLAVKGLIGATGIGLLLVAVTEIAMHWEQVWPRAQAVFQTFAANVSKLALGFGTLLSGLFHFDTAGMAAGLDQMKAALASGMADYRTAVKQNLDAVAADQAAAEEKQNKAAKEAADKRTQIELQKNATLKMIRDAEIQQAAMGASNASAAAMALKGQEIEILKAMEDQKNQAILGKLQERLAQIQRMEAEQGIIDSEQKAAFDQMMLDQDAEFLQMSDAQKTAFRDKYRADLEGSIITEHQAKMQANADLMKAQIEHDNKMMVEKEKHGKGLAVMDDFFHSKTMNATAQAFGNVGSLMKVKNKELFEIGKAAAKAQAIINIAQGVTEALKLGPILGPILAGSVIAAGAVQLYTINNQQMAMAEGGLVSGGIRGVDSVPLMAQQGELVAPTKNFDEVIGSVRAQREAQRLQEQGAVPAFASPSEGVARVIVELKDDLAEFIEMKLIERKNLNLSFEGA